ncbi:MAG: hypothetical protein ACXVPQ_09515 [Bacteroidia bacterium]
MDQRKIFKTLEMIWLISAGLAVLVTVYFLIQKDIDGALYFFFMFLIAGAMYLVRKYQRKKQEGRDERDGGGSGDGRDKRDKRRP